MTQIKFIFCFFFLFFSSIYAVHAATFILWAEGNGNTVKEAKASALTALSQQVISKVESSFETKLSVINDDVNRDSSSVKKIESNLILKGVAYVDEIKKDGNVKITAGLDRAAIRSTIDYMQNQLNVDFSILNRDEKAAKLLISDQLTALISVLPGSVLNDFDDITAWNKAKRDLLLKNIFMGRVVFVSNTPEYTVTIDGKPVKSGVFLEQNNYEFTASAQGKRTMNGQFFVSGGETLKLKLNFVETVSNKKMSLRLPESYGFLNEELEDILADLGIETRSGADHVLAVKIKDDSSEVDGYTSHKINVRVEAYAKKTRIKKVTVRKNLVIQNGEENTLNNEINKLVRMGAIALMSRLDLDKYFAQ